MRKHILRTISYFLFGKVFLDFKIKKNNLISKIIKANSQKNKKIILSKLQRKDYYEDYYEDMQILTFNKKNSKKCILYLHGGSFLSNPSRYHLNFIKKLANKTEYEIIIPIYPKIPNYSSTESIEKVWSFLTNIQKYKSNISLIGDSSGGTLALNLLLKYKKLKLAPPKKLILLSPWTDLSLNNKEILKYKKKDTILSVEFLKIIKDYWIDNQNISDINPISGEFDNSTTITTIATDTEILYPDIIKFHKHLSKQNVENNLLVIKELFHDFMIFPIKEQELVLNYIKKEL